MIVGLVANFIWSNKYSLIQRSLVINFSLIIPKITKLQDFLIQFTHSPLTHERCHKKVIGFYIFQIPHNHDDRHT